MKASLSRMLRSGIAMLIVLCMVAAVIPSAVFATDAKKDVLGKIEANLGLAEAGLNELHSLIATYGPEAAMEIWAQWEEHGYVASVTYYIELLKQKAADRYGYYQGVAQEIGEELAVLESEKNALAAELTVLTEQLAAKKAELEEVLAKNEIGSVTAPDFDIDVEFGNTTVPGNDCNVEGETAKEELEAAIADLEHAIAVLTDLIADIDSDIRTLAKLATEIADAAISLGKTISDIVAAAQDLAVAFNAIAEVMTNESAEDVAEQFVATVEAAGVAVKTASNVLAHATEAAEAVVADIEEMIELAIADAAANSDKIVADLMGCISKLPEDVQVKIVAVIAAAGNVELVEEKLAELKETEEYKKAEQELNALLATIDAEIAELCAKAEAEALAEIAALEAKKAALEAELKGYYNDLQNLPANAEQAVRDQIQAQIDRITGDLAIVEADIAHAVEHFDNALKLAREEVVAEVTAKYEAAVAAVKAQLKALQEKTLEELLEMGNNGLFQITETLKAVLEALGVNAEATLAQLGEKIVDLFYDMLHYATHGEVLAGLNLKYVALGDGSNNFAQTLAGQLAGKAPVGFEFVNAAKPGNTIAGVTANLPADVVGANLITIGFSQTEIIGRALAAYFAEESVDWAALVGEEAVPYVEEILEYVYAEIEAMELEAKIETMVKHIAEAYAYGAVEYAINLPLLVKNIREVNTTAEIVILGMYNPLENLVISMPVVGDIDLSAYTEVFNYLIDGVYGYSVGLALIARDVTYVDAREVEVIKSKLELTDIENLMAGNISALYPNANGDAYIANQIMNALTIKMMGDANNDGKVDSYDAALIARYDIGLIGAEDLNLAVCDINGDGTVDSYDATLVARYDVGLLAA